MHWLLWIVILMFLSGLIGCNGFMVDREYTINQGSDIKWPVTATEQGKTPIVINYMNLRLDATVDTTTSGRQDAKQDVTNAMADAAAALTQAAKDGVSTLRDVDSNFDASQVTKDSYNPTTTTKTTTTTSDGEPKQVKDKDEDEGDKKEVETSDFPLKGVKWLNTDVSKWEQTGKLSSVSTDSGSIRLAYDKAKVWPAKDVRGKLLNANPWIFVKQDGIWYAATFEWFRPGQTVKNKKTVNGDHIKKNPLKSFTPKKGETYGFMVSGLARDEHRNTEERTNVVMFKWK